MIQFTGGFRKGKSVFILLMAALVSCQEVSFREPQPKGIKQLKAVPAELQGSYSVKTDDTTMDTIRVAGNGFSLQGQSAGDLQELVLSDSLVLKEYRGYYFLSIYDKPYWSVRAVRKTKAGDLQVLYMDKEGVSFNDYLLQLSREIKVDSIQNDYETHYLIDPDARQLMNLVKEGYFNG